MRAMGCVLGMPSGELEMMTLHSKSEIQREWNFAFGCIVLVFLEITYCLHNHDFFKQ